MATGDNPITPLFEGGDRPITAAVTAAVSASRFVKIAAAPTGGPLLDLSTPTSPMTGGNLIQVVTCTAGAKAFGVAGHDAASAGDPLRVHQAGSIVPVIAGTGGVTAGQEVMSDASGGAVTWTSAASEANKACGIAVTSAAAGSVVYVRLH